MARGRIGGFPKHLGSGRAVLLDWHGKSVIGRGEVVNCTKIRPGQRGDWISNVRCSYRFQVGGRWYHGRGYGDGMSLTLRPMKRAPR